MENTVILEIINSVLLLSLLFIYVKNYLKMKNNFMLGLILFSGFLLLQNLTAVYFHLMMIEYYSSEVMEQSFYITFFQTVALVVLNYVTWKD